MKDIIEISTRAEMDLVNITNQVEKVVEKSKISDGVALVFTKHTTSGIIVNENESGLLDDIKTTLNKLIPKGAGYKHDLIDTNAHSHLRSIFLNPSQLIPVANGKLGLGTWQSIFFVELDGPRKRSVIVRVLGR